MFSADPSSLMLSKLSECAYRLGMAFGAEAERAESPERVVEYFRLFDRCFFSVRVATALRLRLRREGADGPADVERGDSLEQERAERDEAERDRSDREADRERDREVETASLPVLLRTLGGIAADASALPGPSPAALPTLRELLAQITSTPAPMKAGPMKAGPMKAGPMKPGPMNPTPTEPPRGGGLALRSRLAGSATTQALTLPSPGRTGPGLRTSLPIRRATGPPPR